MSKDRNVVVLKGVKTEWFRLQGAPHRNYNDDGDEWSANFVLDKTHLKQLKEAGCGPCYIKKNDDGEAYFAFKKAAQTRDGVPTKPPLVRDRKRNTWPANTLIGNGSVADIVVGFNEMKSGPNKGKLRPYVFETAIKELQEYVPEGGIEYDLDDTDDDEADKDIVTNEEEWEDA